MRKKGKTKQCRLHNDAVLYLPAGDYYISNQLYLRTDGRFIEVLRPRGEIVSNMGYAEKVMIKDGGKNINPANVR
jgi:hypothetical protein